MAKINGPGDIRTQIQTRNCPCRVQTLNSQMKLSFTSSVIPAVGGSYDGWDPVFFGKAIEATMETINVKTITIRETSTGIL